MLFALAIVVTDFALLILLLWKASEDQNEGMPDPAEIKVGLFLGSLWLVNLAAAMVLLADFMLALK